MVPAVIWLLRHGDAEEGSPDADRRLTERGEREARTAGAALAALGVKLDACLSSPRLRAAETARLACEQVGADRVQLEPALSRGPFDAVHLCAGLGEVLLVGHEPDLSNAVRELTGARVELKKGALAGVEDGELRVLLRPGDAAALGR